MTDIPQTDVSETNVPETDASGDFLLPFQIEPFALRGRLVRLGGVVDRIVRAHGYPDAVGAMLGEAIVLAVLLAGALKYEGVFTLQTKGDGPISLMVADVTSEGAVRGYAQYDAARLAQGSLVRGSVPRLLGAGYLAFTVDQGSHTERYQGIVALEGAELAECVHHYFRQSEQIETGLIVAAVRSEPTGAWRAGGLMAQRLPPGSSGAGSGGVDAAGEGGVSEPPEPGFGFGHDMRVEAEDEGWRRALMLMGTTAAAELTGPEVTAEALLFRLFHEEGVRVWPAVPVEARCRCSRARIDQVLRSFPRAELKDLEIDGDVVVTCEFCNRTYRLNQAAIDALYA